MIAAAFRDLATALGDVAFERADRGNNESNAEATRREALSQALLFNGFARALLKAASAIEARRAETAQTGSVADESAGPQDDAPPPSGPILPNKERPR